MTDIRIEMNYRDEAVWIWLSENNITEVTSNEIASEFNCHVQTAYRILKRLRLAGYIETENRKRGGVEINIKVKPCPKN